MSTSLPIDVQEGFLRTIAGLENSRIMRPGYAIEYDCLNPLQLAPSLALKNIRRLYSAGQSNGTSGYEEAAAQGLIAGINAVRELDGLEPIVLKRSESYIGVLIDDLVTKGTEEPYRIMTSRAEYRLVLRQDNADLRLTQIGYDIGLVTEVRYQKFLAKKEVIESVIETLRDTYINPNAETIGKLTRASLPEIKNRVSFLEYLRRPEVSYDSLAAVFNLPELSADAKEQIEIIIAYEGYIKKQEEQIARQEKLENKLIPTHIDYNDVKSLRDEAREKLNLVHPRSLGQASRISGVSPADISVLLIYLDSQKLMKK